jgi:hypothetical protein
MIMPRYGARFPCEQGIQQGILPISARFGGGGHEIAKQSEGLEDGFP